jgi:hypothetical protein
MNRASGNRVILLAFLALGVLGAAYFGPRGCRAVQEVRKLASPVLSPVPTRHTSHRAGLSAPDGVRVFPYAATCRDAIEVNDLLFVATDVGLVRVQGERVGVFHRAGGLPATRIFALAVVDRRLFALAPEGLLAIHDPGAPELDIDLYAPRDGASLLAWAVAGARLVVADDQGRLLEFADREFGLLAAGSPAPAPRLALLGDRPVIAAADGRLQILDGRGEAAELRSLWPADQAAPTVTSLTANDAGVAVGTPAGVWQVDELATTQLSPRAAVSAVAVIDQRLWLGDAEGRLQTADGEVFHELGGAIHAIRPDGDGALVATAAGVYRLEPGGSPRVLVGPDRLAPFPEGYVTALLPRPDGRVLVGTMNRGLAEFDPATGRSAQVVLPRLGINRVVAAGERFWVATTNGLFELDAGLTVKRRLGAEDGLPHRYVSSVLAGEDGVYMTTSGGLAALTPRGLRAINAFHGLAGNHLYSLARRGGVLAVGGLAGLTLVEVEGGLRATRTFTAAEGLPHNWVNAVVGSDDAFFAGTYGGGVVVIEDEDRATSVIDTAGISINPEAGLATGEFIVFGTLTQGILVRRDGRWTRTDRGLPSANVTALAAGEGGLWVGLDRGLAFVPWENLAAMAP